MAIKDQAPVMDALMGHFVYICIFMDLVDVQAMVHRSRIMQFLTG
jgi:hypothetical protein